MYSDIKIIRFIKLLCYKWTFYFTPGLQICCLIAIMFYFYSKQISHSSCNFIEYILLTTSFYTVEMNILKTIILLLIKPLIMYCDIKITRFTKLLCYKWTFYFKGASRPCGGSLKERKVKPWVRTPRSSEQNSGHLNRAVWPIRSLTLTFKLIN